MAGLIRGGAFVTAADGSTIAFNVPGSVDHSTIAWGINHAGEVVGEYETPPNGEQNHGFIRDADGTITSFDAPKLGSTQVNGIASSSGMIVANFSHNQQNGPPNIGLVRSCILCP